MTLRAKGLGAPHLSRGAAKRECSGHLCSRGWQGLEEDKDLVPRRQTSAPQWLQTLRGPLTGTRGKAGAPAGDKLSPGVGTSLYGDIRQGGTLSLNSYGAKVLANPGWLLTASVGSCVPRSPLRPLPQGPLWPQVTPPGTAPHCSPGATQSWVGGPGLRGLSCPSSPPLWPASVFMAWSRTLCSAPWPGTSAARMAPFLT